jgi:diguanylate cyclase (GGDEF)-like protein
MIHPIRRFFHNATTAANVLFGMARQIDYKTLNRYIIAINQCQTLDSILHEASLCLKDILNYHLFAFAVQDRERMDVWIDPRIYQEPLKQIIQKDFGIGDIFETHAINDEVDCGRELWALNGHDLLSYSLIEEKATARMYILPERKMLAYHTEILEIIVKTLGVALNNYLSIKRLEDDVAVDSLTGCYNRREFDRLLGHHIAAAHRSDRDLSVIMLDIDHFKQVNDTYGHQAGDAVLKSISKSVLDAIRKGDYLARYGGEEFIVVLPDTQLIRAVELAQRLRNNIENLEIQLPDGERIRKTASFGVATLREHRSQDGLVGAADARLYAAKENGRNQVFPATDSI